MTRLWSNSTKLSSILVAILLIAGNIGDARSSLGGFKRLFPYVIPAVLTVPAIRLQVTDADGSRSSLITTEDTAVLLIDLQWRQPTNPRARVGIGAPCGAIRNWVELGKIAIFVEDIDSRQVHMHGMYAAKDLWFPEKDVAARCSAPTAGPGPTVSLKDMVRFVLKTQFEVLPGRYALWATYYADPPFGAGINGGGIELPHAHISWTPWRQWVYTQSTPKIEIEVGK